MRKIVVSLISMMLIANASGFAWFGSKKSDNQNQKLEATGIEPMPLLSEDQVPSTPPSDTTQPYDQSNASKDLNEISDRNASGGSAGNTLSSLPSAPVRIYQNPTQTFNTPRTVDPPITLPTSITGLPVSAADHQIVDIQNQINDIIKLNESLKIRYENQAQEIQKINEQAKIHQRILSQIESTRAPIQTTDALLVSEKVKIIADQTQRNKDFIASLGQVPPSQDAKSN